MSLENLRESRSYVKLSSSIFSTMNLSLYSLQGSGHLRCVHKFFGMLRMNLERSLSFHHRRLYGCRVQKDIKGKVFFTSSLLTHYHYTLWWLFGTSKLSSRDRSWVANNKEEIIRAALAEICTNQTQTRRQVWFTFQCPRTWSFIEGMASERICEEWEEDIALILLAFPPAIIMCILWLPEMWHIQVAVNYDLCAIGVYGKQQWTEMKYFLVIAIGERDNSFDAYRWISQARKDPRFPRRDEAEKKFNNKLWWWWFFTRSESPIVKVMKIKVERPLHTRN